jgi:hypothetical protein
VLRTCHHVVMTTFYLSVTMTAASLAHHNPLQRVLHASDHLQTTIFEVLYPYTASGRPGQIFFRLHQ